MIITKEFAPLTIKIETQAELDKLKGWLYNALRASQGQWRFCGGERTLLEQEIDDFLRKLG